MRRLLAALLLLAPATLIAQTPSSRGDANADNLVNTGDVTFLAQNLLGSGPAPLRSCLADVNADATVSPADMFRLIDFVAAGGAAPPPQPSEVCDGADNDCDAQTDEGFNLMTDANNCGACGNVCGNLNATTACTLGECNPTCIFGFASCDNNLGNGCETALNTNPACLGASFIGEVAGDGPSSAVTATGRGEAWFRVTVREDEVNPFGTEDLLARVSLTVPADTDYDLYVYCQSCGGALLGSSSSTGPLDQVDVGGGDVPLADDTFSVIIEVRFVSTGRTGCGNWSLEVRGDTGFGPATCNP